MTPVLTLDGYSKGNPLTRLGQRHCCPVKVRRVCGGKREAPQTPLCLYNNFKPEIDSYLSTHYARGFPTYFTLILATLFGWKNAAETDLAFSPSFLLSLLLAFLESNIDDAICFGLLQTKIMQQKI
jgi:hypothetical protein